jgi:nucleotide-binding universal stress UspA family protein
MTSRVVVGYDQSPSSESALDVAAAEAVWRGAELIVVHAFHRTTAAAARSPHETPVGDSRHAAALRVAEQGAVLARSGHTGLTVHPRAAVGFAPAVLAQASADADLLVVGHRGHGGFAGLNLGSVALRSVTRAVCPIVVVRGGERQPRGMVLAAVDIADSADEVLDFAFTEAAQRGARLKAVSGVELLWPFVYADDNGQLRHAKELILEGADAVLGRLLHSWQAK